MPKSKESQGSGEGRDDSGRYKRGYSGNTSGRGKVRQKKMSDTQLREYLGRRTKGWIDALIDIAEKNASEDPALAAKVYQGLIKADFDMRIGALKKEVAEAKKGSGKEEKEQPKVLSIAKK